MLISYPSSKWFRLLSSIFFHTRILAWSQENWIINKYNLMPWAWTLILVSHSPNSVKSNSFYFILFFKTHMLNLENLESSLKCLCYPVLHLLSYIIYQYFCLLFFQIISGIRIPLSTASTTKVVTRVSNSHVGHCDTSNPVFSFHSLSFLITSPYNTYCGDCEL